MAMQSYAAARRIFAALLWADCFPETTMPDTPTALLIDADAGDHCRHPLLPPRLHTRCAAHRVFDPARERKA